MMTEFLRLLLVSIGGRRDPLRMGAADVADIPRRRLPSDSELQSRFLAECDRLDDLGEVEVLVSSLTPSRQAQRAVARESDC